MYKFYETKEYLPRAQLCPQLVFGFNFLVVLAFISALQPFRYCLVFHIFRPRAQLMRHCLSKCAYCALNLVSQIVITTTGWIPLLVDLRSPRVPSAQQLVFRYWHEIDTHFKFTVLKYIKIQETKEYLPRAQLSPQLVFGFN